MHATTRTAPALLLTLILAALALALYGRSMGWGPVWDDHFFVAGQSFLADPRHLLDVFDPRSLFEILPVRNAARPMWLGSVLFDRLAFGGSFAALRASSLLWHAAGAALLAVLAAELGAGPLAARLAAVLFMVHPLHIEAVTIVTFRADLLAFVFSILSLILHARAGHRENGLLWGTGSLLAFALALLSKESAAFLPLLFPLIDAVSGVTPNRRRWRMYAAFVILLVGYLWFRTPRSGYTISTGSDAFTDLRKRVPGLFAPVSRPNPRWSAFAGVVRTDSDEVSVRNRKLDEPMVRARTLIAVQGSALRRLLWPRPLQADYAPRPALSWSDPRPWAALAGWSLVLVAAWFLRRGRPLTALGLAWMTAALVPVSGLVWMANPTADRYLYFASGGLCLALGSLLGREGPDPRARRTAAALATVLVCVWGAWTALRVPDFRDDLSLFSSVVALDPEVPRARLNLALALADGGRREEAEGHFQAALRLWPQSARVRRLYAEFLAEGGAR
ncbi:MAG TPA: hypothetical protein DCZ01_04350 [Elusimicrobia bacterium]|nr:MAG: hypothetical protein A2X37_04670 [Elusimicrobia bacterium GWA2_66_18]OGR71956.1 MAG: hypothetical protein A2X40_01760 [Elusimicrobia bacterium GWC2_65_9]HAZ07755.1 hypothetical protein [Elusimicrobiota bacterium]